MTKIKASPAFFLHMGSLAIIASGFALTIAWVSLLGYGVVALITSAI